MEKNEMSEKSLGELLEDLEEAIINKDNISIESLKQFTFLGFLDW